MRQKLRRLIIRYRRRREWRRLPVSEYPLEYIGPTDMFIEHGTPLAPAGHVKGAAGGAKYVRPNGLEIHLSRKRVQKRN